MSESNSAGSGFQEASPVACSNQRTSGAAQPPKPILVVYKSGNHPRNARRGLKVNWKHEVPCGPALHCAAHVP
jgi:hypothetical protein